MAPMESNPHPGSSGPSFRLMLTLLILAIVVAALIAYRMIYPFFHHHPH